MNHNLGSNIKAFRLSKGLRQAELCKGICSVSQLSKIENGKVQLKEEQITSFANRLGVSLQELQSSDSRREQLEQELKYAIQAANSNHLHQALETIQKVIVQCQVYCYQDLYVEAVFRQSRFYEFLADWPQVIRLAKEMLTSPVSLETGMLIDLWGQLGVAYHYSGDMGAAFRCYYQQESLIDNILPDHPNALRIYNGYAANQYNMRNLREALRYGEKAYPLAVVTQRHIFRWRVLNVIALSLNRLREQRRRRYEILESCMEEANHNGVVAEARMYANNLGTLHFWDQDYENAQRYQELSIRYGDLVSDVYSNYYHREPYYELALIFIRLGQLERSASVLEKLRALCENKSEAFLYNARIPTIEAEIAGVRGQRGEQIGHLQRALKLFDQHNVYLEAEVVAVQLAELLEEQDQISEAIEMYRRAIDYQRKVEETRLPWHVREEALGNLLP